VFSALLFQTFAAFDEASFVAFELFRLAHFRQALRGLALFRPGAFGVFSGSFAFHHGRALAASVRTRMPAGCALADRFCPRGFRCRPACRAVALPARKAQPREKHFSAKASGFRSFGSAKRFAFAEPLPEAARAALGIRLLERGSEGPCLGQSPRRVGLRRGGPLRSAQREATGRQRDYGDGARQSQRASVVDAPHGRTALTKAAWYERRYVRRMPPSSPAWTPEA
jgi:hypothetical protein